MKTYEVYPASENGPQWESLPKAEISNVQWIDAPGIQAWGQLCYGICFILSALCSHVCVSVCFSRHCYVLCWGSCPRARGRSVCTEGLHTFLSSLGCSQEL